MAQTDGIVWWELQTCAHGDLAVNVNFLGFGSRGTVTEVTALERHFKL